MPTLGSRLQDPAFAALLSLNLDPLDYVIFGSAPLLAHGLIDRISDLDVLARGSAWQQAISLADPRPAPSGHGNVVVLCDGLVEIWDSWTSPAWDTDDLINDADLIDDLPFVPLPTVLAWKRAMDRPEDAADAERIETHLKRLLDPTRADVERLWLAVADGDITREAAHRWTAPWVEGEAAPPDDGPTSLALTALHGFDLAISDPARPHLVHHGPPGEYVRSLEDVERELVSWQASCQEHDRDPAAWREHQRALAAGASPPPGG